MPITVIVIIMEPEKVDIVYNNKQSELTWYQIQMTILLDCQ